METSSPKRKFFEKPSIGSVIVFLLILALVLVFGLYREQQYAAKLEAAERIQAQASKQAYLDGVEQAVKDLRRLGISESNLVENTVELFRQNGATDSQIEAMKKRLFTSQDEKR
jgi:hypothetical protein